MTIETAQVGHIGTIERETPGAVRFLMVAQGKYVEHVLQQQWLVEEYRTVHGYSSWVEVRREWRSVPQVTVA